MHDLPHSLTAIRVFDAAAKHSSCSQAAKELCLSQSAVSKQLRALEEFLGVTLFLRVHQGLLLTEAGHCYWHAIRPALAALADATGQIQRFKVDSATLELGIPPTLGQKWLIPRLADFQQTYPWINIQFAPRQTAELRANTLSAEIRFGTGKWPGMSAHYLFGKDLYAVCSPLLLKRLPVHSISDLLQHTLIEHMQIPHAWSLWFSASGIAADDSRKIQKYEQFSVIIPALLAGLGTALMPRFLIAEELKKKKLVIAYKQSYDSEAGFHLVYPKDRPPSSALQHFSDWLIAQAKTTL